MAIRTLLEEAKIKFPKGTKFRNKNIIPHCDSVCVVKRGWIEYINPTRILVECHNGINYTIYKDGVWAEIIELPKPLELNALIFN